MASKRTSHEGGQGRSDDRDIPSAKRRQANPESENNAQTRRHLSLYGSTSTVWIGNAANHIAKNLEPKIRKMVREELQRCLTPGPSFRSALNQLGSASRGRRLHLCFMNQLPETIFTESNITAEGGKPLQIELIDAANQQRIVRDEGSSIKIQICVLDGDFGSDGKEDWTADEFKAQIASPREGRGPLLKGDTVITLKNGVGSINKKIVFTDICRNRSRTFRLGLQILQSNYSNIAADVREGRSQRFRVKDRRGEPYKKHDRPSLNDEVWRLKGICENGRLHEQLTNHGIKTVKDFLRLYITNQASLKEKIGKTVGKYWKIIIAHAEECDLDDDDERYCYFAREQSISLVFNCIYDVVEVTFDGLNYRSILSLNHEEKRLVERAKQQAYNNLKDLIPLDPTTYALMKTPTSVQTSQYVAPDQNMQQLDFSFAQEGQAETWPWPSSSTLGEQVLFGAYTNHDGVSPLQTPSYLFSSNHNQWEQPNVNPFGSFGYGDGAECSNQSSFPNNAAHISRKGKSKTVWRKIRNAFKCVVLHVTRKKAQFFPYK